MGHGVQGWWLLGWYGVGVKGWCRSRGGGVKGWLGWGRGVVESRDSRGLGW